MDTTRISVANDRPRLRFGTFVADLADHRLERDGQPVAVTRKAFALLAALLGRPGRLFTKAELFDTVWAGTHVTDAALSRAIRELRITLDDDAAAPRFIATAHGLGFRFVALVSVEGPRVGSSATPAAPDRRLVGRATELAELDRLFGLACTGKRQVVFVTGEAGIGKTSLVDAFIEGQAGRVGLLAAQGRCIEQYGPAEAFLPILEALESLARQVGAARFRDVFARYAPAWLRQLPWLARVGDAVPAGGGGEVTAQSLLREIAQALEVLAAEQPVVMWLEDLHWSDPSSLAVVSFLAGRRESSRLLLIASFRGAEARSPGSPLHGLAVQLLQRGQASELALDPLDAGAVSNYLRRRFDDGAAVPFDALGAFVHRRTDGNPLFAVAIVNDLVRSQALSCDGGLWALNTSLADIGEALPESLRHLVHAQIERLADDDRALIEAAAVAGTEFSAASVAAALDADTADTEDRCARLARQGRFLRERAAVEWPDGTVASGFAFIHALYWQGTHERVAAGRRAEWQRRIGVRQEQAHDGHCGPIAAELAMRFEAARDTGRALRYLQMAGQGALARCAYLECIGLLRRAIGLLHHLPEADRPRHELDLLLPLGAALMAAQGYAASEVETTYQRALALCRVCGRPGELERVLRGLWNVVFLRADLVAAQRAAEELLGHAEASGHPGHVFDALTKLGQTGLHRGDLAMARRRLEQALALPLPDDDPTRLREAPRATAYLAWVLWYMGEASAALALGEEALALSHRTTSPHSKAFALGFVSWLHVFSGDMPRALALAGEQRALTLEHGLIYWRLWADFTGGMAQVQGGDAERGTHAMSAAIDEMRATGAEVGIAHFLCLLADAELASGTPARALATLARAEQIVARNQQHAAEVARLRGRATLTIASSGSERAAARCFASALAIADRQGARWLALRAATDLARLNAADGQTQRAIDALGPIYAGFGDGSATTDVRRAKDLLDELMQAPTAALAAASAELQS